MSTLDVKELRRVLVEAGFLVFRVRDDEVHLAERQNVQLMEAGVRVRGGDSPAITVVIRTQRSDSPDKRASALLDVVRDRAAGLFSAGYTEIQAVSREIRSVSDPDQVTDLWHEVTLRREISSMDEAVAQARLALATERYIVPDP